MSTFIENTEEKELLIELFGENYQYENLMDYMDNINVDEQKGFCYHMEGDFDGHVSHLYLQGSDIDNQLVSEIVRVFKYLKVLYLDFNSIIDISALSSLTNLTYLGLGGNNISDISALSSLTNLTDLNLEGNSIIDISALSSLTNLTDLWLYNNSISDISSLSSLTNLTRLDLGSNSITDISALSSLTNLSYLILYNNGMTIDFVTPNTNATVIQGHIDNGCSVSYTDGNTVTGIPN